MSLQQEVRSRSLAVALWWSGCGRSSGSNRSASIERTRKTEIPVFRQPERSQRDQFSPGANHAPRWL